MCVNKIYKKAAGGKKKKLLYCGNVKSHQSKLECPAAHMGSPRLVPLTDLSQRSVLFLTRWENEENMEKKDMTWTLQNNAELTFVDKVKKKKTDLPPYIFSIPECTYFQHISCFIYFI